MLVAALRTASLLACKGCLLDGQCSCARPTRPVLCSHLSSLLPPQRLSQTQQRVEQNVERVTQLRAEAATLERLNSQAVSSSASAAPAAAVSSSGSARSRSTMNAAPAAGESLPAVASPVESAAAASLRRSKGLSSSLDAEEALKEFWYPAEFTSALQKDTLVPFELFEEPWVLFRDEKGRAACIRDECAHRACPLSLGKVVDGQVSCAYHGWEFDGSGNCTKMPSTVQCRGVRVAALPCVEKDGFVWVWPGYGEPSEVGVGAAGVGVGVLAGCSLCVVTGSLHGGGMWPAAACMLAHGGSTLLPQPLGWAPTQLSHPPTIPAQNPAYPCSPGLTLPLTLTRTRPHRCPAAPRRPAASRSTQRSGSRCPWSMASWWRTCWTWRMRPSRTQAPLPRAGLCPMRSSSTLSSCSRATGTPTPLTWASCRPAW